MPLRKRRFMMGNALVVNLVVDMEKTLDKIFDERVTFIECLSDMSRKT